MELKEQYKDLVKRIKQVAKEAGGKLRNEDMAKRMGYNPNYFSTLTGGSGVVSQQHIDDIKLHFKNELEGIYVPVPEIDDQMNPERALLLAMLEDYAEWKAAQTGQTFEGVKDGLTKRATTILHGLRSWIPEVK